jgi:crotonobetaine/carnitine-CoA ligase
MTLTFPHFEPTFPRAQWTLPAVLRHQVRIRGHRSFLSFPTTGETWSYAATDRRSNRLANGFRAAGVTKGGRVGLLLPNCPEFIFAWFGLAKLGAVEVAISDAYVGAFLAHPLKLSRARLLVSTAELAVRVADIEADVADLATIYLVGDASGVAELQRRFRRIVIRPFADLESADDGDPGVVVHPADPVAVLMTSGTTGPSKGVVMRHSHMYFFAEEDVQLMRLTAEDVYMTAFPLFHGNAQFLTVYPCLIAGAHCALYPRFSASDWSRRAVECGATAANLLGATMAFILDKPEIPADRQHAVRRIYAAPLAPNLAGRFTARFGVHEYVDGFGQTEISNIFMTPPGAPRPPGASGVLVDQWFEIRLADPETGEPVPPGQSGELWIRPKATGIVAYEYLGMPERTVEAWRDLWFHTGDMLRVDAEGWYYFVDRVKDALRRRGENISSFEVERGVLSHPAVAQCAVIGVRADEDAGEDEVMAFIVLKPGAVATAEEIWAHCDRQLPAFMRPRYLEFIDALPLTATEKVQKKALRERGIGPAAHDRVSPASRSAQ